MTSIAIAVTVRRRKLKCEGDITEIEEEEKCYCVRMNYVGVVKQFLYGIIGLVAMYVFMVITLSVPPLVNYWYIILLGIVIGIVTTSTIVSLSTIVVVYLLVELFRGGFFVVNVIAFIVSIGGMIMLAIVVIVLISFGMCIGGCIRLIAKRISCKLRCEYEMEE